MDFSGLHVKLSLKGNTRGVKAKKHIIYSFVLQGVSVLIGLLYIPLLLDYLTQEKYGIWLTLTSILSWFSFFDIGLGNGLRNKLAEALAIGDYSLGQKYVSTTYALLVAIFGVVLLLFYGVNHFLDWNVILNTVEMDKSELYLLSSIVFTFFIIRFVVQLISVIYLADQKPAITKLITTTGNLLAFSVVFLLTRISTQGNLILLGSIISIIPVLLLLVISFFSFNGKYRYLSPSITGIDLKLSDGLINLGFRFFFLQITAIIIFSTSNVFITQFYGPEEVVVYNIAFKYFQVPTMVFAIIMTPIWTAVTDAYTQSDFKWLKKTLKLLNIVSVVFVFGIVLMVLISNWIYSMWVGDQVQVPISLSIFLGIYAMMQVVVAPYSQYINGTGKIKLTMTLAFAGIPIYLVLVFIFGELFTNSTGIIVAIVISSILGFIIQPIQTYRLLNKTAKGIWNK